MRDDTRPDIDALIAAGSRDVADADRCEALGIAPAAHQLHRRLREVIAALAAEHERADRAERERDAAKDVYAIDVVGWREKAAQEMYRADTAPPTAWLEGWHAGWVNRHQATSDSKGSVAAVLPVVNPYEASAAPSAALAAHDAEVKAQALEDAAAAMDTDDGFRDPLRLKSDWVRHRATAIREESK